MQLPVRRQPIRELVPSLPGAGFVVREYRPTSWPFRWHQHPELELTLIDRGSGVRYVGDQVESFAPGDCVLLGPDLPHSWTAAPKPGRQLRSLVVQFPPTVGLGDAPEARILHELTQRASRGLALGGALARETAADMERLLHLPPLARLGTLLTILARIADADHRAARPLATAAFAGRPSDDRLAAVLAFIHERAANGVGQPEVAARAGLSPAAFSRFFRRATGKSFVDHLNDVRVGIACRALAESDRAVTAVALDAGFANLANFNRRFRAITGMTPSAYRATVRSG